MKITFLGTGTSQGVPVIACECEVCKSMDFRDKRLRTAVHIEVDGNSFVIDSGPDFRQQMLRENINRLDALIFTHEHKDHTAGMDDVRSFNFKQKRDVPVYARDRVIDQLKQEFAYVFEEVKYPGVPSVEVHQIHNEPFQINGVTVVPIDTLHYKLPVFGFRIGDFTYITDANFISEAEKEKIKGSRVIVVNGLQKTEHISHFTLAEAVDLINEFSPEKGYITHISHKLGLHAEVSKELPERIHLAHDGLSINL